MKQLIGRLSLLWKTTRSRSKGIDKATLPLYSLVMEENCPKCGKITDRYNGKVCGDCARADARAYYIEHKKDATWLAKERARCREKTKRFWPKYKAKITIEQQRRLTELKHEWRKRNKDKVRAHNAVSRAIRKGSLQRGCCFVCGALEVEAHHPDYSRLLDVVWLCRKHHAEVHRFDS